MAPALIAVGAADAQVWTPGPGSNQPIPAPPGGWNAGQQLPQTRMPAPPVAMRGGGQHGGNHGGRWGGSIGGRWYGGVQAPGGWGAYRRPSRGWTLPGYWMTSNFRIPDYYSFGLSAPAAGMFWVRYYDDAVLVDARGRVMDWSGGIAWGDAGAWDGGWGGGAVAGAWSNSESYSNVTVGGNGIATVDPNGYYAAPPGGYAPPVAPPPPAVQIQPAPACPAACPPQGWQGQGGYYGQGYYGQYGQSYYGAGGYYGGGYYYSAPVTTVVIQSAPVITTTTVIEEVIEDSYVTETYVTQPVKRVLRKARPVKRVKRCRC
ncbi:RcnB family protein [Sphingomonas canadensis]|uniref:RcnB family protein n=2 Tax=Sphingomonas canadensis TaxID=1219257 RepID=A0ABW3H8V8_9SPHN|nr:RcnB family protein [Sphingomonas canadensis]